MNGIANRSLLVPGIEVDAFEVKSQLIDFGRRNYKFKIIKTRLLKISFDKKLVRNINEMLGGKWLWKK